MNPPFANQADIKHTMRAYSFLKPGGRLVGIVSESCFWRQNNLAVKFRVWLDGEGGTSEKLPAGTFERAGTQVETRLIVVEKEK